MNTTMLKSTTYDMAVNMKNKKLIAYPYENGEIDFSENSTLISVCKNFAEEIENHFKISLRDYDIKIREENTRIWKEITTFML